MQIRINMLQLIFLSIIYTKAVNSFPEDDSTVNRDKRMVKGDLISINEVPYTVYIEMSYKCTGVIVSRWNIITAAHCGWPTYNIEEALVSSGSNVRAGYHSKAHYLASFTPHPNFTVDSLNKSTSFDIAVIRLNKPLVYDNFTQPIKYYLPENKPQEKLNESNVDAMIVGWGINEYGFHDHLLKKLSVTLEDTENCQKSLNEVDLHMGEDQGCFGAKNISKYPCFGDSGGPLTVNKNLLGINIYGGFCDTKKLGTPSVFTKISSHLQWIDKYVQYD